MQKKVLKTGNEYKNKLEKWEKDKKNQSQQADTVCKCNKSIRNYNFNMKT